VFDRSWYGRVLVERVEGIGEQVGTAAESKRVIHATVIGRRHSNP
jgi:polyphosphate kinase 2 (PPK2 family)